jgi:hypothetical protein
VAAGSQRPWVDPNPPCCRVPPIRLATVAAMVVPCAQLKVFSPLESLSEAAATAIRDALDRGDGLSRSAARDIEAAWSATALPTGTARPAPEAVQVRRVAGRTLVCPLQLEVRAKLAYAALAGQVPSFVLEALVPDPRGRRLLEEATTAIPHVLDHPFVAPLSWFLAFVPGEQRFTDPPEGRGPRLVHLTTVGQAGDRLDRVLDVVGSVLFDADDVLAELGELSLWIEAFDPGALLELDHGPAGRLRGAAGLKRDSTCAQLWRAVEALEEGDDHAAAVAYATARAAWSHPRQLAHAS